MLLSEYAGVHDVELHPDFAANGWIYISYSEGEEFHNTTVLDRIRLEGTRVKDRERLFTANQWSETGVHHAGRIQLRDGYVFMSLGDRRHETFVQDRTNHLGTIIRLHDDGKLPDDNPFVGMKDKEGKDMLPEIWSWGHRNPQGLYFHPETGELWSNEHGPRGGDELNKVEKGANYGWPIVSFGFQYEGGIYGKGITSEEGMTQPVWVWVPSIGPSDLVYYNGDAFPNWKGSWMTGSLAMAHLNRVVVQDGIVVLEERLANGLLGRIRTIGVDSKGYIYLGTDGGDIWKLSPRR
jgi:glucose/arabinose dehydrogenase